MGIEQLRDLIVSSGTDVTTQVVCVAVGPIAARIDGATPVLIEVRDGTGKLRGRSLLPAKMAGGLTDGTGKNLATGTDEAVFWTGIGRGGDVRAANWVARHGGSTLEITMAARGIRLPAWDPSNPAVVAAWRRASTEFAAGARGNIRVLQGDAIRLDAIWVDEFKALKANPNVTSIRAVNPDTGAEVLLWSR